MKAFFRELWGEYRDLAKALVASVLELVILLGVATLGAIYIESVVFFPNLRWFAEWAHAISVTVIWVGLLGSFTIYAWVFLIHQLRHRYGTLNFEEEVRGDVRRALEGADYVRAIAIGVTALVGPAVQPSDLEMAVKELRRVRERLPADRMLNIFLGRLYKRMGDYGSAIAVLSQFIELKRSEDTPEAKKDVADALYNRACYAVLRMAQLPAAQADEAKANAYRDLAESFSLSTVNRADARRDTDFTAIGKDEQFRSLVEA